MTTIVRRTDLVYPELSYKIIGCAYEVFNELGGGHNENVYQKALDISFSNHELIRKQQVYYPITFKGIVIKRNFFDFLVEEKIVVEIKSIGRFYKRALRPGFELPQHIRFKTCSAHYIWSE